MIRTFIYPGGDLNMDMMTDKRVRLTIKTIRAFLFMGALMLIFLSIVVMTVVLAAKWQGAPSIQVPRSTVLYDGSGKQMGETHYGQKRYWVSLKSINPAVIDATLAVEDRNFFRHHGFDYMRMGGALIADLKAMSKVQEPAPLHSNMRETSTSATIKHGKESGMKLFIRYGSNKTTQRKIFWKAI